MQKRELNDAMVVVLKLVSQVATDEKQLADVLSRILNEGVALPAIVAFIIAMNHEREDKGFGPTTVSDLVRFADALREPTADNRKRWERRFKAGQAKYWCPDCGFSGNDEDFPSLRIDGKHIACCNGLKDVRYFTRTWSAEEQAAFEAEQERMRPILAARETREREVRERAKRLELKADAVLDGIDGVGGFVNEAEEKMEIAGYIRAIVQRTARSVSEIVAKWRKVAELGPIPTVEIAKAVNRVMLREGSMQDIINHLDDFEPSRLEELEAGEERYYFTREELVHEFTHGIEKWDAILKDREVGAALLTDGRWVITIFPKGCESNPCPCDDCKEKREREAQQ